MTTKQIEELRAAMIAVEDFINEPRRGRDDHPDVTDYRHEVYRVWSPLRDMIAAALTERSTPESEEAAREVLSDAVSLLKPFADAYAAGDVARSIVKDRTLELQRAGATPLSFPEFGVAKSIAEDKVSWADWSGLATAYAELAAMLSASPDRGEG